MAKRKGRPPKDGVQAMSPAERQRQYRQRVKERRQAGETVSAARAAEIMADPVQYLVDFRQAVWRTRPTEVDPDPIRAILQDISVALHHQERYAREIRSRMRRSAKSKMSKAVDSSE